MLKYNLCYVKQGNTVLLLNRERGSWMGCWNGVGGKLEPNETPRLSMLRELKEETELEGIEIYFRGFKTWSTIEGTNFGGLYLYMAYLPEHYMYLTPKKTDEGILDWKPMEWIFHPENLGVAYELPGSLKKADGDRRCFDHHSVWDGNQLVQETVTEIDPELENNSQLRDIYLGKYLNIKACVI